MANKRLMPAIALLLVLVSTSALLADELVIRPNRKKDWKAHPADVKAVLYSASRPLWRQFPDRELKPILVDPRGGPIVLFRRGENGEYLVRLDTGETYWAQYSYQFAHELCHILCGYDEDVHRNKWFEESLCEVASLYTLRAMSEDWKTDPPYANWTNYSTALKKYADERIASAPLPESKTLAEWFADHEATLYSNATDRKLNNVVAVQLLPLLEEEPTRWESVTWLNRAKSTQSQTFGDYLSDWHQHAPQRHQAFIKTIGERFGVNVSVN